MRKILGILLTVLMLCGIYTRSTVVYAEDAGETEEVSEEISEENTEEYIEESEEEIPTFILSYVQEDVDTSQFLHTGMSTVNAEGLPSSYSLVSEDKVTSVKNQEPYGTCWSFATIGSAESTYKVDNDVDLDLSELQLGHFIYKSKGIADPLGLITKDGGEANNRGYINLGSNLYESTYLLASGTGLIDEEELPYDTDLTSIGNDLCYASDYTLTEVKWFDLSEPDTIKQAIYDNGAVAASIYANEALKTATYNRELEVYETVESYYQNRESETNHAILIVGWDDDYSKENFPEGNRPSKNGAWLIKNSWGTIFHTDGYFWMSYEDTSIQSGLAAQYFIKETNSKEKCYQYDGSASFAYDENLGEKITAGNIYQSQGYESLKRVGLFTMQAGVSYTVNIYTSDKAMSNPKSGTIVSSATVKGSFDDAGYHVVDLNAPVPLTEGTYFSVVITLSKAGTNLWLPIDMDGDRSGQVEDPVTGETINSKGKFTNATESGQSFIYSSSKWKDASKYYSNGAATVRIKAFTVSEDDTCDGNHDYSTDGGEFIISSTDPYDAQYKLVCTNDSHHTKKVDATIASTEIVSYPVPNGTSGSVRFNYEVSYGGKTVTYSKTFTLKAPKGTKKVDSFQCGDACVACITEDKGKTSMTIVGYGKTWDYSETEQLTSEYQSISTITLDEKITGLGDYIFKDFSSLTSINLTTVTDIGDYAFAGCSSLGSGLTTDIYLNDNLNSLGAYAFNNCISIKRVSIPETVSEIKEGTFKGCTSLSHITFNSDETNIGAYAFADCTSLETFNVPSLATSIGEYAFNNCTSLQEISVSDNVSEIKEGTFKGCTSLTKFVVPFYSTTIGEYAFEGCTGLNKIKLYNVNTIGTYAFKNCEALESMYLPSVLSSVGDDLFVGCDPDLTIYVDIETSTETWPAHWNYYDDDNALAIESYDTCPGNLAYAYDSTNEEYGVYGFTAVQESYEVQSTYMGEPVTFICEEAFADNDLLQEVILPDSIAFIGEGAFANCPNLDKIIYKGTREQFGQKEIDLYSLPDVDIEFSDGIYDGYTGVFCYQDEYRNIYIEWDQTFLESVATAYVYNENEMVSEGGRITLWNDEDNLYYIFTNSDDTYETESGTVNKQYSSYYLNEEHTKLIIPAESLDLSNLVSNEYYICLENTTQYLTFNCPITGVEEIETQPVITVLDNGDLKIEADEDYLVALTKAYDPDTVGNYSFNGSIEVFATDSDVGAFDYSVAAGRYEAHPIFSMSADKSYVIYSAESQKSTRANAIVNGERTIRLNAYGYEPSEPVNVTFTHAYEKAPADITVSYDSDNYRIVIHSSNTTWLSQINGVYAKNTETGDTYSIFNPTSVSGQYCIMSAMTYDDIPQGPYDISIFCQGMYGEEEGSIILNECNVHNAGRVPFNDIPSIKVVPNDLSIEFASDGIKITTDDEDYLDALVEINNASEEDIMSAINNGQSSLAGGFIYIEDFNFSRQIIICNTADETLINKENGYVYILYSDLDELGMTIFKNYPYSIFIGAYDYPVHNDAFNPEYGSTIQNIPKDFKVSEDKYGNITLSTKTQSFLDNMEWIYFYNDDYYARIEIDSNIVSISSNKITIPADQVKLMNGKYSYYFVSYGYDWNTYENALTIKYHTLPSTPAFTASVNESGDMVITSDDTEWIDYLTNDDGERKIAFARLSDSTSIYTADFDSLAYAETGLEKLDDNTAVFTSKKQKEAGIVSGTYRYRIRVDGYKISDVNEISFNNASLNVPEFDISLDDNILTIESENQYFLDNICVSANGTKKSYIYIYDTNTDHITDAKSLSFLGYGGNIYIQATTALNEPTRGEGYVTFELDDEAMSYISGNHDAGSNSGIRISTNGIYADAFVSINPSDKLRKITYTNLPDGYSVDGDARYLHSYYAGLDKYTYTLPSLSIPGYKFSGWKRGSNSVTSINLKKETKDIVLVANITKINYSISYNTVSGKLATLVKKSPQYSTSYNVDTVKNNNLDLPNADNNEIYRNGYTFEGWYLNKSYGEEYKVESIEDIISKAGYGNVTLYAKWQTVDYDISLNSNGGTLAKKQYYDSRVTDNDSDGTYTGTYSITSSTIKLPTLEKSGYTFNGWYDSNGKKYTSIAKGSYGDRSLEARFTPVSYKISYSTVSGKLASISKKTPSIQYSSTYTVESTSLDLPNSLEKEITRTGYIFDGWYLSYNSKTKAYTNKIETIEELVNAAGYKNVTLYAKWTPITYSITFRGAGLEDVKVDTYSYDSSYKLNPDIFEVPGKTVSKWIYTVNGKSVTVSGNASIKNLVSEDGGNIVLSVYSKKGVESWSYTNYSITYNLNGGTQNSKNKKSYTINTSSFSLLEPTRKGYDFMGWYTDPELTDESKVEKIIPGTGEEEDWGNRTYYAKWEILKYIITFDAGEGNNSTYEGDKLEYTVEDSFTLNPAQKENYTFTGWYNGKTKVTSIKKGTVNDITLTAKWTEGTNYTIQYVANAPDGSVSTGKMANTKVTAGKNITLTSLGYKISGKVFTGWNTEKDGSGTSYKNKETILKSAPLSSKGGETIILYAQWDDIKSFTIHYDANEGTGKMNDQKMSNSSYKALTANTFKRAGYTFTGWNTATDGSGTSYSNKQTFSDYKGEKDGTVTLYAQWSLNSYKITYKNLNSTDTNPNPAYYTIEDGTIILQDPSEREGYQFTGWYSDSKFKTKVEKINCNSLKAITLYAKYEKLASIMEPDAYHYCETIGNYNGTVNALKDVLSDFKNLTIKGVTSNKQVGEIDSITVNGKENDYAGGDYPIESTMIEIAVCKVSTNI